MSMPIPTRAFPLERLNAFYVGIEKNMMSHVLGIAEDIAERYESSTGTAPSILVVHGDKKFHQEQAKELTFYPSSTFSGNADDFLTEEEQKVNKPCKYGCSETDFIGRLQKQMSGVYTMLETDDALAKLSYSDSHSRIVSHVLSIINFAEKFFDIVIIAFSHSAVNNCAQEIFPYNFHKAFPGSVFYITRKKKLPKVSSIIKEKCRYSFIRMTKDPRDIAEAEWNQEPRYIDNDEADVRPLYLFENASSARKTESSQYDEQLRTFASIVRSHVASSFIASANEEKLPHLPHVYPLNSVRSAGNLGEGKKSTAAVLGVAKLSALLSALSPLGFSLVEASMLGLGSASLGGIIAMMLHIHSESQAKDVVSSTMSSLSDEQIQLHQSELDQHTIRASEDATKLIDTLIDEDEHLPAETSLKASTILTSPAIPPIKKQQRSESDFFDSAFDGFDKAFDSFEDVFGSMDNLMDDVFGDPSTHSSSIYKKTFNSPDRRDYYKNNYSARKMTTLFEDSKEKISNRAVSQQRPSSATDKGMIMRRAESLQGRWIAYELDPILMLEYPLMSDASCEETSNFLHAYEHLTLSLTAYEEGAIVLSVLHEAVERAEKAFIKAENNAKKVRKSYLTPEQRKSLATARQLALLALDEEASPNERISAWKKANDYLEGIMVLSDTPIRGLITSS